MDKAENSNNQLTGFSWIRSKIISNFFKERFERFKEFYKEDNDGNEFGFVAFSRINEGDIENARKKLNTFAKRLMDENLMENLSDEDFALWHDKYYVALRYAAYFRTIEGKLLVMTDHPHLFGLDPNDWKTFTKEEAEFAFEKFIGLLSYATEELDWRAGAAIEPDFWDHIPDNITIDELKPIIKERIEFVQKLRQGELFLDSPFDIERQKFVNNFGSIQLSLWDDPKIANNPQILRDVQRHNIQMRGLALNHREQHLLHAFLKIMNSIGINGNDDKAYIKDDWIGFEGEIPSWKIPVKSLVDALDETYGEKTAKRAVRDSEHFCNDKKCLFTIKEKKNGKIIESERVDGLFNLKLNYARDKNGRRRLIYISFRPSAHFYKFLKEGNVVKKRFNRHFKEIGTQYRRQAQYFMLFEDYLDYVGNLEGNKGKEIAEIRMNYKEMAAKLQMDAAIRARQWGRIRDRLNKIYAKAKELGWIIDYKINQAGATKKVDIITFKPHVVKKKKGKTPD